MSLHTIEQWAEDCVLRGEVSRGTLSSLQSSLGTLVNNPTGFQRFIDTLLSKHPGLLEEIISKGTLFSLHLTIVIMDSYDGVVQTKYPTKFFVMLF